MEFAKKQPALLYLDRNGFYFFENGLPTVISMAFLETSVKDMDVINGASILGQVKNFIEQYRITPALITIILSPNITFEKEITGLPAEEQEDAVRKFVDTIPFDSTMSKNYPIEKGVKVIGFNEDLFQELKVSFEKAGFNFEMIIPYNMLGNDKELIQNLTVDNAMQFLRKTGNYKQISMLTLEKDRPPSSQQTSAKKEPQQKKSNIRLFAMIGVFIILFAILGFMLLNMK